MMHVIKLWKNYKMRSTFTDAAVEKHTPSKPHGTRQVKSILFGVVALRQLEPAEWTETIEQV